MTKPRTLDETVAALSRALAVGGESAKASLVRLFSPATVIVGGVRRWDAATPLVEVAERTVCVAFEVTGPFRAKLVLLAPDAAATQLASVLLRRPLAALDADAREALSEMGNIVASSFLNGLARVSRTTLLPSVPALSEAHASTLASVVTPAGGHAFVAPFAVSVGGAVASGAFVATPDAGTVDRLLELLDKG